MGISSAGGGGNTIRNMMVDDRSGLTAEEEFDVYPYVEELTSRLIAEKDSFTMPRKYKVAIDTSVATANYSYIADLGLQARIKDGQRGFKVLIAGSAASNAHTGWEVFDFLPEKDLYRAAKALKNWFHKYGNRRNRHKARMRYVFYKYGTEEAKRLYLEEFEELKKDGSIDFEAPALPLKHHKPGFPAAAFGGRVDIMSVLAPEGPVYQAGTLSGNPVAMAAGYETLKQLGEPGVYELLEERSNRFLSRLEKIVEGKGIQVNHVGTMFTMFFNDQPVHNFISLCHTDEILDYVLKSIEESIE